MRELSHDVENFNEEELSLMVANNVSQEELREFLRTSGPQNLDAAIGGILMLRNGQGQERNEPFQTQAEADAQVSGEAPAVPAAE